MPPRPPPRSPNRHAERRSYLEARTYIRPRVHAISRSCLHLHAEVIIRPELHGGTRCVVYRSSRRARPRRKPGQGSISRALLILSPLVGLSSSPFLFSARSGNDGSTCIQLPRQNRIEIAPAREVVAIYINSRWWSRALMTNTRLPWPDSHGQAVVIDIFPFEALLDDFRRLQSRDLQTRERLKREAEANIFSKFFFFFFYLYLL